MSTETRRVGRIGIAVASLLLTGLAGQAWAQAPARGCRVWALQNRGYYDPLLADVRGANVQAMAWGRADAFPFVQQPGARRIWDISVGKEIPIAGCETGPGDDAPLGAGRWGFGLWTPVSVHMVEDFVDESNPDRKSTRLNSSHFVPSRMPSSA